MVAFFVKDVCNRGHFDFNAALDGDFVLHIPTMTVSRCHHGFTQVLQIPDFSIFFKRYHISTSSLLWRKTYIRFDIKFPFNEYYYTYIGRYMCVLSICKKHQSKNRKLLLISSIVTSFIKFAQIN
ncbi:hypothetical protein ACKWTF_003305 [Chironomus riparius]